jgi:glycosyltransferase involved in cell wall biosynthesis
MRLGMRIVHVVQGLGMGGQERLVVYLSQELAARGHEPAIVTLSPGGAVRAEAHGVTVLDATAAAGVGADAGLIARLATLLHRLKPDVVHTHSPGPMIHAVPAAILARVRRRVHTKHGANAYGARSLWAARALVHLVDTVVAVTPEAARVARAMERVSRRRLKLVPSGVPLGTFRPDPQSRVQVRRELGIDDEAFVVGSVGRLAPERDHASLVRAVGPLLSGRLRLVVVGDGPARRDVERAVPAGREPFVRLTGARANVAALLSGMDAFALPASAEGVPLALEEAMACGLPVVAPRAGELESLPFPDVGVLVRPGDELAIRSAVDALASRPQRARAMGEAARRLAQERFSIAKMADEYERIYSGKT